MQFQPLMNLTEVKFQPFAYGFAVSPAPFIKEGIFSPVHAASLWSWGQQYTCGSFLDLALYYCSICSLAIAVLRQDLTMYLELILLGESGCVSSTMLSWLLQAPSSAHLAQACFGCSEFWVAPWEPWEHLLMRTMSE